MFHHSHRRLVAAIAILAVAGCSKPPSEQAAAPVIPAKATPAKAASPSAPDYAGRWRGVEGMFLDIQPGTRPGVYRLTMQYDLDHRQTVDARLESGALTFARDGKRLALRPTDGDATGLKYLAGKKDCLTVAPGESYCRD